MKKKKKKKLRQGERERDATFNGSLVKEREERKGENGGGNVVGGVNYKCKKWIG
jgi:hypothetical protein